MIGISISDIVLAVQHQGVGVLKKTKGDMWQVIRHVLDDLKARGVLSADDKKSLELSFAEALDVLAGKKAPSRVLESSRKRYASMVANSNSSDVARALAELCQSVIMDAAVASRNTPKGAAGAVVRTINANLTGKGEQSLFWGSFGALVGSGIGGPVGGLIGGAIGAAIGACGDSDTTVTITNNGGGSPE
jgi:hypothetical protein